eukprot:COSAG06_NODE_17313_length_948_cov_1.787986_1_plen_54_part_10
MMNSRCSLLFLVMYRYTTIYKSGTLIVGDNALTAATCLVRPSVCLYHDRISFSV